MNLACHLSPLLLTALLAYFIGSFPTGFLIGKWCRKDLRKHGSGNIGATNATRILGKKWGYTIFGIDFFKGTLAILLAYYLHPYSSGFLADSSLLGMMAAFFAVMGHNFPIWLRFQGGKGVATSAGAILALFPLPFFICLLVWIITFKKTGYVSLASLLVALLLPAQLLLLLYLKNQRSLSLSGGNIDLTSVITTFILAAIIFWSHRSNIEKLLQGTENRFGKKTSQ